MVTISTPSPTPYAGTPLTLTCEVNLGDDVSREDVTSLNVTWSREGFGVLSNKLLKLSFLHQWVQEVALCTVALSPSLL